MLRAFKLDFPVSNNEAEYEALITKLRMARDLGIKIIQVFCDSKLVSAQINTEFEARKPRIAAYLQLTKDLVSQFESFEITHVPRAENAKDGQLARFGSGIDKDGGCPVEISLSPSTSQSSVNNVTEEETWMTPIIRYLESGELPAHKTEAQALRTRAAHYVFKFG